MFISEAAVSRIVEESMSAYSRGQETMGLLYGFPLSVKGLAMVNVTGIMALPTAATAHHVSVDRSRELQGSLSPHDGGVVVGWYHSHTGVGNFMSDTDTATHVKWFSSPHAISIVFEAAEGKLVAYRLEGGTIVRAAHAVYSEQKPS